MSIFVTSDLHLSHDKEFIWKNRGFNNVIEMNEGIVENWNSIVSPLDDVYVLGDIVLGKNYEMTLKNYFSELNGYIHIAIGNHDSFNKVNILYNYYPKVVEINYTYMLKWRKNKKLLLTHYPTMTRNYDEDNTIPETICLCGHTHTTDPMKDWSVGCYHVEVDAHNCYPILLDEQVSIDLFYEAMNCHYSYKDN